MTESVKTFRNIKKYDKSFIHYPQLEVHQGSGNYSINYIFKQIRCK